MRMLTDRGREYCVNRENHEYELYPAVEELIIPKSRRKARKRTVCVRDLTEPGE